MVFVFVLSLFYWIMASSALGSALGSAFGSVALASVASFVLVAVLVLVSSIVGKFYFSSIMLSITEVSVVGFVFGF